MIVLQNHFNIGSRYGFLFLINCSTSFYNEPLLYNQSRDINRNHEKIGKIAKKLYSMYINNHLPEHIKSRCCDFLLLEEKSKDYVK